MNNNIFKRGFLILTLCVFAGMSFGNVAKAEVKAKTDPGAVYIFTLSTCSHCKEAKAFLKELKEERYSELRVYEYDFYKDRSLLKEYYQAYFVPASKQIGVPVIFVGNYYSVGFNDQIGEKIVDHLNIEEDKKEAPAEDDGNKFEIPIFGKISLTDFSFPVLAITLGVADGFNVCSLGALMVILGLVIFLGSRKKVFFLGGLFIITTSVIYGLMIFLWHQFFSLIASYISSLNIFIGILSLVGGIYLLREFYQAYKRGPICSSNNLLSRLTPKIETILRNKTSWFIILGAVVVFAAVVTIIEFPCSAVLPVLFAGYLVESEVSSGMTLYYMTLYILFYMLDELIIFLIAFFTLKIRVVSPKFIILFNLLAALIFIAMGIYHLFF